MNAIYPWPRLSEVRGCSAADRFVHNFMTKKKKANREKEGDHLEGGVRSILVEGDPVVVPCFRALFQGDHLGVEVATAAHSRLLQQHHLLQSSSRLQSGSFIREDETNDGLVIDDYFVLSRRSSPKAAVKEKLMAPSQRSACELPKLPMSERTLKARMRKTSWGPFVSRSLELRWCPPLIQYLVGW